MAKKRVVVPGTEMTIELAEAVLGRSLRRCTKSEIGYQLYLARRRLAKIYRIVEKGELK